MSNQNNLKKLRGDMTLRKLSELSNIDYTTLSRIENGERGMNENHISILCKVFGCSADYLLGQSDNIPIAKKEIDISLDEFEVAFHGEVKDLTPEAKEKILEYARLLKISQENKK